ncbi:MAG: type I-C CRISPR-associated endonuclease Cas1c [Gammaproteobacteria bacterium]|nr:type I-C CRISPR-associated endonuclease Cas1c [Gammaproteobacteria bacterium]MCY4342665.1 type I-C CRISPR-associated endonuclease Cas1c [Gammaproteobacteria bacterium]
MRRHLNTLYVTTPDAWLHKDGENVVVKVDGKEHARVPVHILGGIVCLGSLGATPALMGHCAERGVCISFMSRNGRFLARVEGPVSGNVLLRRGQYRFADSQEQTGLLASHIVTGKIANQRTVVRRALRDYSASSSTEWNTRLETSERRLSDAARRSAKSRDADAIRGIEGEAARIYFGAFCDLVRNDEPTFAFSGRSRRPPLDPPNALLSFLYALLVHDCRSALETVGLDPAVGYLHRERPGRPSLALDLMEELRPLVADRLAISLINRRQLKKQDFQSEVSGAVRMRETARKAVLVAYQNRKKDEILHPFLEERTTIGLVPFVQANLLARHLRGDLDAYPPFLWR